MVPMKRRMDETKPITDEQLIAVLKVPCSDRTEQQIDTILQSVGQWPCFTRTIKSEQMRREVCRHAVLEEHEQNTILFKQGDAPNGWFIIVTGQCCVVQFDTTDANMKGLNSEMVKKLREEVGDKYYHLIITLGPQSAVGDTALIQDKARNATIYISKPSLIIRIDSQVYKDTAAYFQKLQLKRRTTLFSTVKEFQPIKEDNAPIEKFQTIAENTDEYSIPTGTVIDLNNCEAISPQNATKKEEVDQKSQSIYVIAEGKLALYRSVNFSKFSPTKNRDKFMFLKAAETKKRIESDVFKVRKPKGVHTVQVGVLRVGDVFPDPRLAGGWVAYPFMLKAIEPAVVHCIRISDLSLAIPQALLDEIKLNITNQPTDHEIIEEWIERQKNIQWNTYKENCVKEVRKNAKVEKEIMNGNYGLRKPSTPKAIKGYVVQPISKSRAPSFVRNYSSRMSKSPKSQRRPATSL
jgi:hypothetical protein